jgi:DNA repair exonuclease SbcCD ATPase subunit
VVIEEIEVKNFRCIKALREVPGLINVLCGENGAGKTSFLDAIRLGITGNEPADSWKRNGAETGGVLVGVSGVGKICRKKSDEKNVVTLNGKVTTAKSVRELMSSSCGISPDTVNIITSSELMERLSGGGISEYLLNGGYLTPDLDTEKVLSLSPISESAAEEIRQQLPADAPVTLADIDALYEDSVSTRKFLKAQKKELSAKAAYNGAVPSAGSEEIKTRLSALNEKKGALTEKKETYERLNKAYETSVKAVEEAKTKADAISATKPDEARAGEIEKELKIARDALTEAKRIASLAKASVDAMSNTIENLAKPICPISDKLTCKTDKSSVTKELEDALKTNKAEVETQTKKAQDAETLIETLTKEQKDYAANKEKYLLKESLLDRVKSLKETAVKKPEAFDSTEFEKIVKEAEQLSLSYKDAVAFEASEKTRKELKNTEDSLKIYEEVAKYLDPKSGVRGEILKRSVGTLEDWCRERIKIILPGFDIKLGAEDGFTASLVKEGKGEVLYEGLSGGEKIRLTVVLMDMLNMLSEYGILLIDKVESLDKPATKALADLLNNPEFRKGYSHIFVAGVGEEGDETNISAVVENVKDTKIIKF